jgi:hypothetical protein
MQQIASSAQLAKDTPQCDRGGVATTCTTIGVGAGAIGCAGVTGAVTIGAGAIGCAGVTGGDNIVDIGCQSLLPSTQARSAPLTLPFDRCALASDSVKGPRCCPSL